MPEPPTTAPEADSPILRLAGISAAYGRESVLRRVSLELRAGEIVAIAGPNGSGKSSLLKVALGHLPLMEGEVTWFSRPMSAWRRRELARRVAYLPQSPTNVPGQTVADVLASGRSPYWGAFGIESPADRQAGADASELLELGGWLDRDISTLSGGQRQRVFIGRCVVQILGEAGPGQHGAILLDEPDTYLDLKHISELSAILRMLARERGLGILLASHDLNLAAGLANRIVLLAGGAVAATGAPAEVMRSEVVRLAYDVAVTAVEAAGRLVLVPE
jgi:iron complex transport system ATP-binding protein